MTFWCSGYERNARVAVWWGTSLDFNEIAIFWGQFLICGIRFVDVVVFYELTLETRFVEAATVFSRP